MRSRTTANDLYYGNCQCVLETHPDDAPSSFHPSRSKPPKPTKRRFEIAELFPQPKIIELGEGISELATDVRLATINVWPIQRKALRSIL